MLYKWRESYTLKAKKFREYQKLCREMPIFKHARTHDFFETESLIRKFNLHKIDLIKMRTGRGYCITYVNAANVIKHRRRAETGNV